MDLFADEPVANSAGPSNAPKRRPRSASAASTTSSSTSSLADLKVNQEYANRFQHNKARAERQALEEKYGKGNVNGDDDDEEHSSEDETEDEEGEQVTADVDAAILRTLAKIRGKDESIYDVSKRVFDQERQAAASTSSHLPPRPLRNKSASSSKKVTLADYQRSRIQELIETEEDPALALAEATTSVGRSQPEHVQRMQGLRDDGYRRMAPVEEQEQLRKEVTAAFHDAGDGGEEEEGEDEGFFVKRGEGHDDELFEGGPEAYRNFLLASLGGKENEKAVREALRVKNDVLVNEANDQAEDAPSNGATEKQAKRERKKGKKAKKSAEEENEEFLMNYILNRGWVDNPSSAPRMRRKEESEDDSDDEAGEGGLKLTATGERDWAAEAAELESEASFDSRAEAFETAYNFRFEALEKGEAPEQIQSYARNPADSVRRKDDKRKKEREERRKRKEEEKRQKAKELERLKDLKRKDILDRLQMLKQATGSSAMPHLDEMDLEGDFDPEKHDEAMRKAFDERYYGAEDDEKPTWSDDDDIDIADILAEEEERNPSAAKGKKKEKKRDKKKKKGEIEMDADFVEGEGGAVRGGKMEGGAATGGGALTAGKSKEEVSKMFEGLSKKERKKLKKRLAKEAKRSGGGGGDDDDEDEGGESEIEMDADRLPVTSTSRGEVIGSMDKATTKASLKDAIDSYYSLGYEDIVGDQPTRFKYATVPKVDYGLSPEEILMADDAELNEVVGLKHLAAYRKGSGKPRDLGRRVREFRSKLGARRGGEGGGKRGREGEEGEKPRKKRMGKKEREKAKKASEGTGGGLEDALMATAAATPDAAAKKGSGEPKKKKAKTA